MKMDNGQLVPELRFPTFDGYWVKKELKSIVHSVDYRGKGPTKSDSGVFLVTAKNIKKGFIDYNSSKEYIPSENFDLVMSKGKPKVGDIVFTTEAPMGNVAVLDKEKIALAQRVIKFRVKEQLNNIFLLFNLLCPETQRKLSRLSIGSTVKGISNKDLHKVKIAFPKNFQEQQKIANFLTAIDQRITLLKEKKAALVDYKKGLMQKIFSQEVRFTDDEGNDFPDWEEKLLGELFEITSSKRVFKSEWQTQGVPFYRAREIVKLKKDEVVKNELYISRDLFEKYKQKYGAPQQGDLLVTAVGTLGEVYIVKKNEELYFKDGNIIWLKASAGTSSEFISILFYTRLVKKQISDNASISTVGTFTIINAQKTKIPYPCKREQQRIADCLTAIDQSINQLTNQIDQTTQFKKGLLQRMFV